MASSADFLSDDAIGSTVNVRFSRRVGEQIRRAAAWPVTVSISSLTICLGLGRVLVR